MVVSHQKNNINGKKPYKIYLCDSIEFPSHWHEEFEIVYALEEPLKIGINNEEYYLNPRDILLINSAQVHRFDTLPKSTNRIVILFEMSFFGENIDYVLNRKFTNPLLTPSRNTDSSKCLHKKFEEQLLAIQNEFENNLVCNNAAIMARLYDIAVMLIREVPSKKYDTELRSKYLKKLETLNRVFSYIEDNYTHSINLEDVANIANYSVYHFTRFFKDVTGITFKQYLNNYRVAKAVKQLENTSNSIMDVSYDSGFDSVKTFNRVFKNLKGCSPSQYRKANI